MRMLLLCAKSAIGLAILGSGTVATAAPSKNPIQPPAFKVCAACHSITPDGAHSMGPNLRGIVGKKAATRAGYAYSAALKRSNIVWNRDKLDQWFSGPGRMVPGTRMVQTTSNPVDRQAIIEYLSALK